MPTGVVGLGSDLKRKKWMREGLVQASSKSFWAPMTGSTKDAVVMQANNESAGDGHTVVFDFDGNLSGKAIKGKTTAFGKGEQKKKFSDKVTVERYRLVVDNGDKFDGVDIGDLSINEHSDSRQKLGDLFTRFKDQSIFDAAQGLITTNEDGVQASSHNIDLNATFDFNTLLDIEKTLKTSQGFTTGGIRRPLDGYMTADGEPCWLFVIDSAMANMLRKDTAGYQTIVRSGDVRGRDNRNIKGVIGKLGRLVIVEAEQFFGATAGSQLGWGLDDSEIEMSGLRQYSGASAATAAWTGQANFDYGSAELHSRGLILGAGGIQTAFGKMPDYKFQESEDFGIKSESAVEFWMEARKTNLKAENAKYKAAKISDLDYGVVTVDVKVA
tara:strand:+ start:3161 stop:4312 length:1152 start_codon:yes stop_codon:yes gene_type:complete